MENDPIIAVSKVTNEAESLAEAGFDITITDDAGMDECGAFSMRIAAARKRLAGIFNPMKRKAHEAHKEITRQFAALDGPLKSLIEACDQKMVDYRTEQERIVREEREAIAAAEAKEAARIRREEDARLAAAIKADEAGDSERADAILDDEPMTVQTAAPQVRPIDPEKPTGTSFIDHWKGEVDPVLFSGFAVIVVESHPGLIEDLLEPNNSGIARFARQTKGTVTIPGLRIYNDRRVTRRTA